MRKKLFILLASILVLTILLSFVPIQREYKELNETIGNQKIHSILKRACFDCHSYETKWPWYSYIFPANFLISHHIQEGREELNFHNWDGLTLEKQSIKIDSIIEEIETKEMPLKSYLLLHKEAKITSEDLEILREWQKEVEAKLLELEDDDE